MLPPEFDHRIKLLVGRWRQRFDWGRCGGLQAMLFVGCVVAEFGSGHDAELSAK
jgi:hypothetical protein